MAAPLIDLQALTRSYGSRRGVEAVDLQVPEGVLFGFLGPNGAGKTTAIRVLLGLLRPTFGTARIMGLDCWHASARIKADVGYVPGDLRLYPWLTGESALRLVGAVRRRDVMKGGRELAQQFDLDLKVRVRDMSKGMRQKVGLIIAMAHDPRLLILDEPTSGLDPLMQDLFRDLLRERCARGRTVFFSSHSLGEVEQLCDRLAIVREGRIVADASLADLRAKAGHEVTMRFRDAAAAEREPPAFLKGLVRNGLTWTAMLDGPPDPLIRWLAMLPPLTIDVLTIGRPDLEALFRRYYMPSDAAAKKDNP